MMEPLLLICLGVIIRKRDNCKAFLELVHNIKMINQTEIYEQYFPWSRG